jgi:hypothetical protein
MLIHRKRGLFASLRRERYHKYPMPLAPRKLSNAVLAILVLALLILPTAYPVSAGDDSAIFPLSQVQPGMKGAAYTIFTGDEVEKVDLVVLGILKNALGPKQDVILVQLLGEKAEHTGVVAGMSGSPVYFEGKLAGALSLKLGTFTKEAIGGVTPIENMLAVEKDSTLPTSSPADRRGCRRVSGAHRNAIDCHWTLSGNDFAIREKLLSLGNVRDSGWHFGGIARRCAAQAWRYGGI